jgi:hypothetical protein
MILILYLWSFEPHTGKPFFILVTDLGYPQKGRDPSTQSFPPPNHQRGNDYTLGRLFSMLDSNPELSKVLDNLLKSRSNSPQKENTDR